MKKISCLWLLCLVWLVAADDFDDAMKSYKNDDDMDEAEWQSLVKSEKTKDDDDDGEEPEVNEVIFNDDDNDDDDDEEKETTATRSTGGCRISKACLDLHNQKRRDHQVDKIGWNTNKKQYIHTRNIAIAIRDRKRFTYALENFSRTNIYIERTTGKDVCQSAIRKWYATKVFHYNKKSKNWTYAARMFERMVWKSNEWVTCAAVCRNRVTTMACTYGQPKKLEDFDSEEILKENVLPRKNYSIFIQN